MKAYKKYLTKLFAWVLCFTMGITLFQLFPVKVQAEVTNDGFYYSIQDDGTAVVTGIKTEQEELSIPSKIGRLDVTAIGAFAFSGDTVLKKVTIPNGIISIGGSAFKGCTNLSAISIPESVESIGYSAFENCSSLTTIRLPDKLTQMESSIFAGCSNLQNISIPNNVTSIEYEAFQNCSKLESIIIPENVTTIGTNAFSGCALLTTVHIPKNVTSINYGAFSFCTQLKNFTVDVNNTGYTAVDGILFSKDLRSLVSFPAGHSGTYAIPEGTRYLNSKSFDGAPINAVSIPDSLRSFPTSVFSYCDNLTNISVNDNNDFIYSEDGVLYDAARTTIYIYPSGKPGTL